jgi:hypothetical protein
MRVFGHDRRHGTTGLEPLPYTLPGMLIMVTMTQPQVRGHFRRTRGHRRSELVALDVSDLAEDSDGLRVLIARSKTD